MTQPPQSEDKPEKKRVELTPLGVVLLTMTTGLVLLLLAALWAHATDAWWHDTVVVLLWLVTTFIVVVLPFVCVATLIRYGHRLMRTRARSRAGLCEACGYDYPRGAPVCPECGSETPVRGGGPAPHRSSECPVCRYPRVVKPGEAEDERALCPECGARYV